MAHTAESYTQKKLNNHNFVKSCHFVLGAKCAGSASVTYNECSNIKYDFVLCILITNRYDIIIIGTY